MRIGDTLQFVLRALVMHRVRSALTLLARGLGTASVVLLSALGEGARQYVVQEFSSLGTNLLIVIPGRSETTGGAAAITGPVERYAGHHPPGQWRR